MGRRDAEDMRNLRLLMRFGLDPDSNCVDVGANAGAVLREIVDIAPRGRHFAFEPLPDHVEELRSRFPKVEVRQVALAAANGTADFTQVVTAGMSAYSGFRPQWYPQKLETRTIKVETARLDDVLPDDYRPDLIKIDVEGAEGQVVAGGIGTIRTHQPIVVFEHFAGGAGAYGYGPEEMHKLLVDDARLRIFDIDGNGPYSAAAMREVFDSRRLWTWVARR
jgi:FkbM family methyltransferase